MLPKAWIHLGSGLDIVHFTLRGGRHSLGPEDVARDGGKMSTDIVGHISEALKSSRAQADLQEGCVAPWHRPL